MNSMLTSAPSLLRRSQQGGIHTPFVCAADSTARMGTWWLISCGPSIEIASSNVLGSLAYTTLSEVLGVLQAMFAV
jgi:hypothetical protein